jgi:hypothetical protein
MSEIIKQINFLKSQRWIDLTHQVTKDIPYFPSFSPRVMAFLLKSIS